MNEESLQDQKEFFSVTILDYLDHQSNKDQKQYNNHDIHKELFR
jgi:hypothetical protein